MLAKAESPVIWKPNPGPQTRFLASTASEVLFGGASGGGKSAAIIAAGLRWVGVPQFRALVLRREATQLQDLIDKSWALYKRAFPEAKFNANDHTWTFPSGARIRFNHCKDEADKYDYQGQEYQLLIFDELTHFTQTQYLEIASRLRSSTEGLPRYLRATSNPGGKGHEWVLKRWGAWLNPDFEAEGLRPRLGVDGRKLPPAEPGEVLWVVPVEGGEAYVPEGTKGAQSRQFIPARLSDNPKLLEQDPDYARRLRDLDPVRRAQLEDGNWLIQPGAGLYFKRGWTPVIDVIPSGGGAVRAWDLAATVVTKESPNPDWTVGVKFVSYPDGTFVVSDVTRLRGTPGDVEKHIKATAEVDGKGVQIRLPQDPGQAGKAQVAAYAKLLAGWSFQSFTVTGDKVTRFGPFSSQAQAGNVRLLRGPWNEFYIQQLEGFPDGDHDDDADATSDAFNRRAQASIKITQPAGSRGNSMDGW